VSQIPPQNPPPLGPLNYQQPHFVPRPPPARYPVAKFLGGMGAGTLFSAILWPLTFDPRGDSLFAWIIVMLLIKISAGVTFLCMRPYRMLGGGILTSLALGFLIFFGVCANNINLH
jgi:hypothetical protein